MLAFLILSIIIVAIIVIAIGIVIMLASKERHMNVHYLLLRTTLKRPLFNRGMRLFDYSTGDFYNRIYSNYNYYYFPSQSSRDYLLH
jgi:hypothetical protein